MKTVDSSQNNYDGILRYISGFSLDKTGNEEIKRRRRGGKHCREDEGEKSEMIFFNFNFFNLTTLIWHIKN
jgi:hypothetical protein